MLCLRGLVSARKDEGGEAAYIVVAEWHVGGGHGSGSGREKEEDLALRSRTPRVTSCAPSTEAGKGGNGTAAIFCRPPPPRRRGVRVH